MENNNLQIKQDFNIANLENEFINYVDVSEKTIENYKDGIENFIRFLNTNQIDIPTRKDVINWRNYLRDNYSASTVNSYLTAVKVFFKFLETNKLYHNITNDIKGSKVSNVAKKEVLSLAEVQTIYRQLTDKREKALFSLLISCGLRGTEVANARITDIKEYNGETVLWVKCKKRNDYDEYVKLADNVLVDIKNYIEDRKEGYIFTSTSNNNNGGGITTKTLRLIIKNIFSRFGLDEKNLSLHSTRRSSATLMYEAGQDLYSIQQVLHHRSQQTTTRYINNITRNNNNSEKIVANLILEGVN